MAFKKINLLLMLFLFLASVCLEACTHEQKAEDSQPADPQKLAEEKEAARIKKEQEKARIRNILAGIHEKNRTVKKSPEWLGEAYSGLKIKRLNDIRREEYASYRQYVPAKEVYFIVHPGYYAFFDNKTVLPQKDGKEPFPSGNLLERLAEALPMNHISMKVMMEQERLLRNFLEFMSVEKRLAILVLPADYRNHLGHGYTPGIDEYARYINEMTNMSESIIYMESQTFDSGYISPDDLKMLSDFLKEINASIISYGGGYVGKCLGEFSTSLMYKFRYNNVFFVPDLSSISPFEINEAAHGYLLADDGRVNANGVIKYYKDYGFNAVIAQKSKSRVKRLKYARVLREDPDSKSEDLTKIE